MADHSHLDSRYFIDQTVYNCPFCNRRNVEYSVPEEFEFDWTDKKTCRGFLAKCSSCRKTSMHLTFEEVVRSVRSRSVNHTVYQFAMQPPIESGEKIDTAFFYSVPTSFFALNDHIPVKLRELFVEADGCLKSNHLTGASACARKLVYELAVLNGAEGENYDDRIKSLKEKLPTVDGTFFDTLLTIQQLTSAKVHENALDGWRATHLRTILASLVEILHEIYVVPAQRQERRQAVLKLSAELQPKAKAVPTVSKLAILPTAEQLFAAGPITGLHRGKTDKSGNAAE